MSTAIAKSLVRTSCRQELFDHLADTHGLTLLESELDEIERIVMSRPANVAMVKDALRLDWIEAQSDGTFWVARMSTTGRGFRLHNSSGISWVDPKATAREAIDAMMKGPGS